MSSPAPSTLQRILEARLTQLAGELQYAFEAELAARLTREMESQIGEAVRRASGEITRRSRQALAEDLNQWLRRLRQASPEEAPTALLDGAMLFADGAALIHREGETLHVADARGLPEESLKVVRALEFPLAGAFSLAAETGDPVTALADPTEVPPALREAIGAGPGDKVVVVPLAAAGRPEAFLFAWSAAQPAALELVAQMAAPLFLPPPPPPAPAPPEPAALVSIAPAEKPAAPPPASRPWEELSPEEQRLHLAAQRFARVQAAEIRLRLGEAVERGRLRSDLYAELHEPIDAARDAYRRKFVEGSPGMVDYLHLQILRTLAHDDHALLGPHDPGPLL
jgi:hypothetical protein